MSKQTEKKVVMNNKAYGITRKAGHIEMVDGLPIERPGSWQLVEIDFNLESGKIGDMTVKDMEDLLYTLETVSMALEDKADAIINGDA